MIFVIQYLLKVLYESYSFVHTIGIGNKILCCLNRQTGHRFTDYNII